MILEDQLANMALQVRLLLLVKPLLVVAEILPPKHPDDAKDERKKSRYKKQLFFAPRDPHASPAARSEAQGTARPLTLLFVVQSSGTCTL